MTIDYISFITLAVGLVSMFAAIFQLIPLFVDRSGDGPAPRHMGIIFALLLTAGLALAAVSGIDLRNTYSGSDQRSTGPVKATAPIAIDARRNWQDTGFIVQKGGDVRIRVADGEWSVERIAVTDQFGSQLPENIRYAKIYAYSGPEDDGGGVGTSCREKSLLDCPVVDGPIGALVARIGASDPVVIGRDATVTAPETGELQLQINDSRRYMGDNAGMLAVEIAVSE